MTMLTHPGDRPEPASHRSGRWNTDVPTTPANLAMLKRFWLHAVGLLLAGAALAGIIALKAAIFLSRINF